MKISIGSYLGYPKCCIDYFGSVVMPLGGVPTRKLNGTGFIPCPECNDKYTEQELIDIINENRQSPFPFPNQSDAFHNDLANFCIKYRNNH